MKRTICYPTTKLALDQPDSPDRPGFVPVSVRGRFDVFDLVILYYLSLVGRMIDTGDGFLRHHHCSISASPSLVTELFHKFPITIPPVQPSYHQAFLTVLICWRASDLHRAGLHTQTHTHTETRQRLSVFPQRFPGQSLVPLMQLPPCVSSLSSPYIFSPSHRICT